MEGEAALATKKWCEDHTKQEGEGDDAKYRCSFHFCNKVRPAKRAQ